MPGRKKEEQPAGAPAWMVTYGDMVTLLLTFFVLLLSFSSIQESKFKEAIGSLKGSLGLLKGQNKVVVQSYIPPVNISTLQRKIEIQNTVRAFQDFVEREELGENVKVQYRDDGLNIIITDPVLFNLGKADLLPGSFPLIERLAGMLAKIDSKVRVKGHTCDLPIHNLEFDSNWELSSKRALAVIKILIKSGTPPDKLSAVAYSQFKPIYTNDTEKNRRRNRRVEIFLPVKNFNGVMNAVKKSDAIENPVNSPVVEAGYE